jgi:LysR family glycine cleavage system transcriptional activator
MSLPRRSIPSFTSLMAFEATARYLSFSQAAQELALTQGAVSKQVRQLEHTLGIVLLERTKRQVVLTEQGKHYLKEVRDLLHRLEVSTHSILASGDSEEVLNLAVLPSFATRWLLPRLSRFLDKAPKVTVNLATRLVPFAFEHERFDSAIHYGSPSWPGTVVTHLFDEEIVAVASPAYCEALKLKRPEDLARATLLQQSTRLSLWSDWFEALGVAVDRPYSGPMFDQFMMAAAAASGGIGVALVPAFLIDTELADGRLQVLFDQRLKGRHGYYFVTPTSKVHNQTVRRFTAWLEEECRPGSP